MKLILIFKFSKDNDKGEITDKYKAKNVSIISSSEKLICPDFDDKFYANLDYYINAADVKVHISQEITTRL